MATRKLLIPLKIYRCRSIIFRAFLVGGDEFDDGFKNLNAESYLSAISTRIIQDLKSTY